MKWFTSTVDYFFRPSIASLPAPPLESPRPGGKRKARFTDLESDHRAKRQKIFIQERREGHDRRQRSLHRGSRGSWPKPTTSRVQQGRKGSIELTHFARQAQDEIVEDLAHEAQEVIDELSHNASTNGRIQKEVVKNLTNTPTQISRAESLEPESSVQGLRGKTTRAHSRPPRRRDPEGSNRWDTAPTKEAWKLFRECNEDVRRTKEIILQDKNLDEPEYTFRYAEIRDGLWQIMDKMEILATTYFGFTFSDTNSNRTSLVAKCFQKLKPETVKIIECTASGGPEGNEGWLKLFFDEQKRRALVLAIIGNVLVEQVFQHPFFGGSEENAEEMEMLQSKHRDEDGFDRKREYADYIRAIVRTRSTTNNIHLPLNFELHVERIVAALVTHLRPILALHSHFKDENRKEFAAMATSLGTIVAHAGILSLLMQTDRNTVYYMAPVLKEDNFLNKYMECFNPKEMEKTNPRERSVWPAGVLESEKRRAQGDEALNQIIMMNGVTAYRRGGWEASNSGTSQPKYAEETGATQGIRSRILTHAWVFCRWGRPRRFEHGRPKDDRKVHGKIWKGGFVEFRDVKGVPK